jgi:SAM-dependent methyltransferase
MALYSKHDRILRKLAPSVAKLSYNPLFKIAGDSIARMLARPFPELRELPPNHLCIRVGSGNRIVNGHINFIKTSSDCWLTFLSRNYCTANSRVVELGCGCGRVARVLKDPWFEGTYVGVDIDDEMLDYCRHNFPPERFEFIQSPHKSIAYSSSDAANASAATSSLVIAKPDSKDFVYSLSLYSHLLENEATDYLKETYRILKPNGTMFMTFFCLEHVELGGRWTFQHQHGNAYVESVRYPEAAVAYHKAFMIELASNCGFREITVADRGATQSELVARK